MKNTFKIISVFVITALTFTACQRNEKDKLVGKWRISAMHLQYIDQQQQMNASQLQMMQDSIAANTDTAKIARFQKQLAFVQDRINTFKADQDSMQKNRWNFQANGDFEATETDGNKKGIWSYDADRDMLFTVIDKQTASVEVKFKKDTMILQLDSLNYMSFVKAND